MNKLCCIFNTPSLYRESIYKGIDYEFDCDWYFEDTDNRLKVFDVAQLKNVGCLYTRSFGPFYWVKGLLSLLRNKKYGQYLMMGHSRNLSTFCFLLMKNLLFRHKRVYLWTHGLYGKESRFEYIWKKSLFGLADELLVYGDYACNLMKKSGLDPEKIHAIHNSLSYDVQMELRKQMKLSDVYHKHFGNNNPVIIFIGRLNPVKKLDMLVHAVASLKRKQRPCNLIFVGDGPESSSLNDLVLDLDIKELVWFYGACYDEKTNAEFVFNADLCVAPGNIGLTAIHALMFGCPVITHDDFAHQMPEFEAVKAGVTGGFFERDNLQSLIDTIDNWVKDKSDCRDVVRRACYNEIDTNWTPLYQLNVLKAIIK